MRQIWCCHVLTQWLVSASELRFFCPVINLTSSCCFFFNFWEEECSLFLLGGGFYSHSTVSKNSLFSDLAQTVPMTGRALSPQHYSQSPGHPAKADLSFMGVLGLVLKERLLKGHRKEKERNQFPGKAEAWCWRRKTYWLPKWNGPEPEGKAGCSKKRMWPLLKEE